MADSNIGSLPAAVSIDDDSLLVAEQQGEAVHFKGKQLREFAESAAANVKKGDKGDPGEDFKILGYFSTLDALKAAVTTPNAGNAYGVGTVAPYTIYVWDGVNLDWKDNGTIQGPTGATFTPSVDGSGNLSWTNDGGLDNPETVNIKGGKGDPFTYNDFTEEQLAALKGKQGDTGTTFTPSVDSEGNLSWSNDGNKDNPETVNIKGNKGDPFTYEDFTEEQIKNLTGPQGSSIKSIARTSGTGAAGTTDTYTITMSDGSTFNFQVYNGADGKGSGDMLKSIYDPQNKNTDVFDYVDKAIANIDVDVTADEVTFSDGETFQQKYDSGELTGPAGATGKDGSPGADGDDGVGVASVEQTTTSTADGGENVITVTLTNGTKYTFTVKNGSKGSDGAAGKDGAAGAAATINGVNALTLAAEEPLALEQSGNTATLKLTGDAGVTANEASATLTTSGWTTHSVLGYQQTVTVTGITAAAKAISTDVELSTTDKDSNTAILAAYALIAANPATAGANKVTFYAESIPEVNVPVVVGWL